MPVKIEGSCYLSASDIYRELGISRQTLWRWRRDGKIPMGRRYRDHQVLYTRGEVDEIRHYANRLEPAHFGRSAR